MKKMKIKKFLCVLFILSLIAINVKAQAVEPDDGTAPSYNEEQNEGDNNQNQEENNNEDQNNNEQVDPPVNNEEGKNPEEQEPPQDNEPQEPESEKPDNNENYNPPTNNSKPKPSSPKTDNNSNGNSNDNSDSKDKEDNFYITNIILKGIKENEEIVDIPVSPEFNKDTYEYTCNIDNDIKKIELEKDAGNYTDSVVVTGLEELKEGENIIKLELSSNGKETKTYTIKATKESKKTIETVAQITVNNKKKDKDTSAKMSMPVWKFAIMQICIVLIEVLIFFFILKKILSR